MVGAFALSVSSNLVSKLGECLLAPIGRQFAYVLRYKSYVEDLKKGVNDLKNARERVQCSVVEASYDGKPIHADVKEWLENVMEKSEEAEKLLRDGETAKDACFRGCLPNPMVRHPIGRKVKKMTRVIQELHQKSKFTEVYYENPPIGIVNATTSTTRSASNNEVLLESRASIIEKVIKAIDDDKVCVVGVYGLGGVGKSKLLADIKRRVKEEKMFDIIATANVSRNPNIKRIQEEIAYAVGLKPTHNEPICGTAHRLCERLESDSQKNILIILDNLWEKLELKEVGIPCGEDNRVRGCKLLLTSRYRQVLFTDMCSDREFRLDELKHEEARKLFERIVGHRVKDPEIKPLVERVVKNCGGLPLLIVPLAKRLKRGDLTEWRNALTNIEGSAVRSIVELNYNDLKEERIKSLFLVCALDSGRSCMRDSLVYCLGLGLFKNFSMTIENNRDALIVDLRSLQDSSLLLDSDDMEVFRMHDKFVDVAISISSTKWYALVGKKDYGFKKWSKDELSKCTAISFNFVGISEIPENLDCPCLRILLLCEHNSSLKVPNSFFESMKNLQVLDITGLSLPFLPSSIEFLENLKSLCLDCCHLQDVTALGKLKGLEFLSFSNSKITQLPKEIGELTELRFLDLTRCTELILIEPGVLESLANLEELHMEDSFDQWEVEDEASRKNASLAELKNMKNLSTLSISIPHSANLSRDLPFGKLNRHKIQIGEVWDWLGECKECRTLKLKLDSGNLLLEEWVQKCLQTTQDLHLDGLQDDNDSISDLCIEGFQELKHLHLRNSPSVQYVVHSIENVQCTAFTRLESLFLENLNNLEKICRCRLTLESFSKLKIVKVDNCGEIKHMFPLSMMRIFSHLEEIEISRCHLMQQIVANVEVGEDRDKIDDDLQMKSCNLHSLTLQHLPEMRSFSKTTEDSVNFFNGQQLIKLQRLEAITIESCPLIQEVFDLEGSTASGEVKILSQLREITLSDLPSLAHILNKNSQRTLCFRNLRTLKVQNCDNLRFLFSCSMAKTLGQIKEIYIARCKLIEEIIDAQEEGSEEAGSTDTLTFPLLTSLSLEKLPNLMTFFCGKYGIHCPSLIRLTISGCPKMTTFSSFEGKQQLITADIGLQQAFGHVDSRLSLPIFFHEKVLFPSLEELKLSSMCQLKRIWQDQLHGQSFCKLVSLKVEFCENLSHVFPSNLADRLQSLNEVKVVGCPTLEALFEPVSLSSEKRQEPLILRALEKLNLLNLPRLTDIMKSDCKVTLAFPSLTKVKVGRCHSLPYLFSSATAKKLHKLEALDVSCCSNLWGIIAMEEGKEKTVETFKFHYLRMLKLGYLENLISFCSASCASNAVRPLFDEKIVFPKLEELHIEGVLQKELWNKKILAESCCYLKVLEVKQCRNLMNVFPSSMWKRPLHCMESLTVEKCPHLINLFTMSMAKSLGRLQYLYLVSCREMEYIVAREEEKPQDADNKIVIPQLITLYLHNMPKLRSFCQVKHISEWPSLKEFTVIDCKAVEVIIGYANCRKPEDSVSEKQPLLLVEKVWSGLPQGGFTFGHLRRVETYKCENLKSLFPSLVAKSMTQLEELIVHDCGVEEIIVEEDGEGMSPSDLLFPQLIDLRLLELPELRSFYKNSHISTWPLLKELRVRHCGKMRSFSCGTITSNNQPALFSFEKVIPNLVESTLTREDVMMMQQQHYIFGNLKKLALSCYHDDVFAFPSNFILLRFLNLEELSVICCSFENLFPEDASGHREATLCGGLTDMEKPLNSLGNLERLDLYKLSNLRRVWKDGSLMAEILKQIKYLFIEECPSLSILLPSPISLQRLKQLDVKDCAGLVHMGTCSAVTTLVNLKWLTLRNCGAMEDVVTDDGNGAEEICFPMLKELILDGLPSLESFSPLNCPFGFPSLARIVVIQCPKMNIFCRGALTTPNLDKVLLNNGDDEWCWEVDLNTTVRTLSN